MDPNKKYKLSLGYDEAQALRLYLTWVIEQPTKNAYVQMMLCLVNRVRQKLNPSDYGKTISFKLNVEQSMALQMVIAMNPWPGNYIDHALHLTQQQLPPLIYDCKKPPKISWDGLMELPG